MSRAFVAPDAEVGRVKRQVFNCRQRTVEVIALRHDRNVRFSADRVGDDIHTGDGCMPARRQHSRGQHADSRRLARAVRAEQDEDFVAPDSESVLSSFRLSAIRQEIALELH